MEDDPTRPDANDDEQPWWEKDAVRRVWEDGPFVLFDSPRVGGEVALRRSAISALIMRPVGESPCCEVTLEVKGAERMALVFLRRGDTYPLLDVFWNIMRATEVTEGSGGGIF